MWSLGGGRRGLRNSGEAGGLGRAEVDAGCPRRALGPVWEVGRGGDSARGGVRRWQASAATGAPAPASSRPRQENGRRAQLYGIPGKALGVSGVMAPPRRRSWRGAERCGVREEGRQPL
jgi:hypothetical protein